MTTTKCQDIIQSLEFNLKLENQNSLWTNMLHILAQRGAFFDSQKLAKTWIMQFQSINENQGENEKYTTNVQIKITSSH